MVLLNPATNHNWHLSSSVIPNFFETMHYLEVLSVVPCQNVQKLTSVIRFRWVSLQLQFLRTLKRADTVWKRLGELPKDLSKIYDDIYRVKIEDVEEQGAIAKNAFNLLLSLQTPLKHEEFLQALSFCGDDKTDVSAEDLLDFGCNFLVLDTELDVFRFAHLSVREYLDTRSEYSPESSHALAARFCLRHLCTSDTSGPFLIPRDPWPDDGAMLGSDGRIMSWEIDPAQSNYGKAGRRRYHERGYPFLNRVQEYACAYWANHVAGSRDFRLRHPLSDMLRNFTIDTSQGISPWFMYWNRLATHMIDLDTNYNAMPQWSSDKSRILEMVHLPADYLFAASIWGFRDLLELRLRSKPDPLSVRSSYHNNNALQLACSYGNRDSAEFLLDRGWGLQVDNSFSLLGLAIEGSHFETVKLLLSRGANPNGKLNAKWALDRFPVFEAIESGSLALVKILLDYGASADAEDYWGLKTFHVAASDGKQEIADLLLATSTDADEFPRTFCGQVALVHKAVDGGDWGMLKTALEVWPQGARGEKYLNSALWKVVNGFYIKETSISEMCANALLAKGADANCSFHGRPLVRLLASFATEYEGRMMLSARRFSILQLLVDHGADLGERKFFLDPEVGSD